MRLTLLPVAVVLLTTACGGSSQPAAATAPVSPATPVPTPAPTPTPVPLGQGRACGLPVMAECGAAEGPAGVYGCCTREFGPTGGVLRDSVNDAIEIVQREQPSLFDGPRVLDREAYQAAVARTIELRFQLCAKPGGPGDEVGIKNSNGFSEQYDIYLSNARVYFPVGYQVTCRPARF